jgi:hypothetical protein
MIHIDCSAADMERRRNKAFYADKIKTDCGSDHIDNGVECADFVEVNALDRFVVHTGLGFCQAGEDLGGAIFY